MSTFDDFIPDRGAASYHKVLEPWLCVAVAGSVVERRSFLDDVECALAQYQTLLQDAPRPPDLGAAAARNWRRVPDDFRELRETRCSSCGASKGRQLCNMCGGAKNVYNGQLLEPCAACMDGYTLCDACAGSGKSVQLKVEYGEDHVRSFAHIFVPFGPAGLQAALRRFIAAQSTIPSALEVDLHEELASADAYRGRGSGEHYRGHRVGQAWERAQQYIARITRIPSVVAERHTTHVWPFVPVVRRGGAEFSKDVYEPASYGCLVCNTDGKTLLLEP